MFRRLIEEKQVGYKVVYGNVNDIINLTEKKLRKRRGKTNVSKSGSVTHKKHNDKSPSPALQFGITPAIKPRERPVHATNPDVKNDEMSSMINSLAYVEKATCPKCNKQAKSSLEVRNWFGYHKINGRTLPYAWCINCRMRANNTTMDNT